MNQVIHLRVWSFSCPPLLPSPSHPLIFFFCLPESLALRQNLEDQGGMSWFPLREKVGARKRGAKMLGRMLCFSHHLGMGLWALFSGFLSCALWMHPAWWYLKAAQSMVLPLRQMCCQLGWLCCATWPAGAKHHSGPNGCSTVVSWNPGC